jgi:hypothetical protein
VSVAQLAERQLMLRKNILCGFKAVVRN